MEIEVALLTGGASRRMGVDKARVPIDGVAMADRLVQLLTAERLAVTVLGRSPIDGVAFLQDAEEFAGPLSALARFQPVMPSVLLLSCDLPLFDPRLVSVFASTIGESDAVIPMHDGRLQPLCALYLAESVRRIREVLDSGRRSMFAWVEQLNVREIGSDELEAAGIDPRSVMGVNTPGELDSARRAIN